MPRVTTKDTETKARILEAAREMFAKKGFSGTSIRDIATASGMSNPTIYYHYTNKEGIILALLAEAYNALTDELSRSLNGSEDPLTRFRLLLRAHLKVTRDLRSTVSIFHVTEHEKLTPETMAYSRKVQRDIFDLYSEELERLRAAGLLRTQETRILAFNIAACINWLLRWYHDEGDLPFEQVAEEIVEFVLHGMLAAPETGAARSIYPSPAGSSATDTPAAD
jgi:TetR/AcrR family transcriptional regulator, cholesterol catabolism regulator